jgi:branched-chain amino acid transport system permease protein
MDIDISLILAYDGLVSGAIYASLGLAVVLIFTVTRVLFLPQGDLVAYGALTLAGLTVGQVPGTVWFTLLLGCICGVMEIVSAPRQQSWRSLVLSLVGYVGIPLIVTLLVLWLAPMKLGMAMSILLTLLILVPIGPYIYRIAFQPVADASVLKLLFIGVAVHFILIGAGLLMFGPEGVRVDPITDAGWSLGPLLISGQSVIIILVSGGMMALLFAAFEYTLPGRMLRATAINRLGARIVGIQPSKAGLQCFALAALIGVASGILIAPITPIFYDSGFVVGLKGVVASVLGGVVSYPLAAVGAILIGVTEAFMAFWYSSYKDVLVFTLVIPVLIMRSLTVHLRSDEDE